LCRSNCTRSPCHQLYLSSLVSEAEIPRPSDHRHSPFTIIHHHFFHNRFAFFCQESIMANRKNMHPHPHNKKQRTSWIPSYPPPFFVRPEPPQSFYVPAPQQTQPMPPYFYGRVFGGPPQQQPPPLSRLTDIFKFTPFGLYCCVCCDGVGTSESRIKVHLESRKHGFFFDGRHQSFESHGRH
jgi:hypothetical protein